MVVAKRIFNFFENTKWTNRSIFVVFTALLLSSCQSRAPMPAFDEQVNLDGNQETVVLLHGMWRDSSAMDELESFFSENGYEVLSLSYPSNDHDVQTLVEQYLHPQIDRLQQKHLGRIHFVTHSMGGILVRYYLKHYDVPDLGRVVMIAPPNHGSELTEVFEDAEWFAKWSGPAAKQLNTKENSWVNELGGVGFELGVVAGNYNANWITSWILPGQDDGVVTTENTKVEGMKDFLLVPEKHYKLRRTKVVMQQAAFFLKNGMFYQSDAPTD